MFIEEIIENTGLSASTKAMYKKVFVKIGITNPNELSDKSNIVNLVNSEFKSDESKKIAYNAICKVLENKPEFDFYNNIRNQLKSKIEYDKSDNRKQLPMTYDELINVPNMITDIIDRFFIYMHVMYPLRLDYYNIPINREDTNYMTYDGKTLTFYLNSFKNVKSMGKQVITYNDPNINTYMRIVQPKYLLYQHVKNGLQIFNSRAAFGNHLTNLFKKYTGKKVTINDIRKIHESKNIQDVNYAKMSNKEKNSLHNKYLHKTSTANASYNIISN